MPEPVLPPVRDAFRALAATVVPEAADLDGAGWARLEAIVERALAERPEPLRRQLVLFVKAANWMPVARWGRTLARLGPERRFSFLRSLERAPVLSLRRGVWGVRTLVFMGYYGQEGVRRAIGYRAHLRGWRGREDAARPGGGP